MSGDTSSGSFITENALRGPFVVNGAMAFEPELQDRPVQGSEPIRSASLGHTKTLIIMIMDTLSIIVRISSN